MGAEMFPENHGLNASKEKSAMNRNRIARAGSLGSLALLVLTLGLAGCGSDEPAAVTPPAPPPAPPPFQPQPVEVALGELGGTVTLMTTEAGGFTLNGEAFEGGDVTAENGNTYALTLADGQWTAAYQAATVTLTLGITGEEVTVMRAEDGTYWIGDEAFEPGGNFAASNGNHYMLALADDGSWTASYVPATAAVTLGITGEEVTVMRAEDGSYHIGDTAFSSGGSVTATNGNEYTLTMADGTWTAAYVPLVQQVAVGNSGLSVPFTRHENGTWTAVHPTLGEQPVTSGVQVPLGIEMYFVELLGDGTWRISYVPKMVPVALGISGQSVTVVKAENGTWSLNGAEFASGEGVAAGFGTYTLTLGSGDTWTATFQEVPTTVTLGTSGDMVTVVMVEDGSYTLGGDPFASGGEVTAGNGNVYQLTLAEGAWSAMFVPMDVEIQGTGLTAMTREDQDGWDVNGARVPKSGTGDITVHGASFHVWHIDGDLLGARFDKEASTADEADYSRIGDLDSEPTLSDDNEDTVANELRTSLTVGGTTFTIADLLGSGSASASGDNFVAAARSAVEKIRGDVAALLGLDTAPTGLTTILGARWGAVQTEVDKVFGSGEVKLGGPPNSDDLLGEIDDIIAALSSGDQFAAATASDGGGVFEDAGLSESEALDAFEANATEASIVFGHSGETRYGAMSLKGREEATDSLTYNRTPANADDEELGLVGAFSYGTTNDVVRVWHIQTSGSAYYEGGTTAVSGNGDLYTGNIELEVRFATKRVSGLVTNLQTAEGDPWQYQFGDVEAIILPTATDDMDNNAHWGVSGQAEVTFERRAGSPSPQRVDSTFAGQLLGTGDASGDWAHGVWTVGANTASGSSRYLAGSFGASRVADIAPVRPETDDGSGVETLATSNDWLAADATRPNSFKVADGKLTVTMNLFERLAADEITASLRLGSTTVTNVRVGARGDPDGDGAGIVVHDDLVALDTDTETPGLQAPTQELSVSLASLIANSGTEVNTNGPKNQVEIAVDRIETARADLAVLQALDTRITGSEEAAWKEVQTALLGIFHHVPTKLAGSYDEDRALELIDSVLQAFSTSASLKAAIDPDGTGIFNTATDATGGGSAGGPSSYSVIWGRQAVQMKVLANATDYTRFGAWRVQQDAFADGEIWRQPSTTSDVGLPGNRPGLFAYSPLPTTQWSSSGDPSFPLGGSATFTGKSVAMQGKTFFEGTVEVLAEWTTDAWVGATADIGDLTITISGLMNADGDPLRATNNISGDFGDGPINARVPGGAPLESVTYRNITIGIDADGNVGFEGINSGPILAFGPLGTETVVIRRTGPHRIEPREPSIHGQFVGQDGDGALAVLGTYWTGSWGEHPDTDLTSVQMIAGGPVDGAFGADRP